MSEIIIPRKHLTQPQGRVAFHPAWEELVGAVWMPSERRFFGPSFAAFPTISAGGGVVTVPGPAGLMSRALNETAIYVPTHPEFWRTDFTVAVVMQGGIDATLFGARPNFNGYRLATSPAGVTFTEFGFADRSAAHTFTAGKTHVISVNAKASVEGNIAADGRVISTFTSAEFTATAGNFGLMGWIDGPGDYFRNAVTTNGVYSLTVLKANNLAAALALHEAPYQIFQADPIRIYSLPSGPISVSWSSLTASGITPTTATLTLGGITR